MRMNRSLPIYVMLRKPCWRKKQIKLYELIGISDGLLSDYSSVAVDYLLLDRPLGYVLADYNIYKEKRDLYLKIRWNICRVRKSIMPVISENL